MSEWGGCVKILTPAFFYFTLTFYSNFNNSDIYYAQ